MDRTALDLPAMPKTVARPREGLFANHWALYIGVVLFVALASYAYWLKTRSIFACQAQGYSADRYLAYCGGGNYADFEHGAFYFNLEPPALEYARNADVLVLGNSRLQIAMSNQATADWFKQAKARYYLLGFSYNENMNFTGSFCVGCIRARASSSSMSTIFSSAGKPWPRRRSCTIPKRKVDTSGNNSRRLAPADLRTFPRLCGQRYVIFRSRETGSYYRIPREEPVTPENAVSYDQTSIRPRSRTAPRSRSISQGIRQGEMRDPDQRPLSETKMGNVKAIAAGAGLPLVAPELDGLSTSDGYHLDRLSADRWARAFLRPRGRKFAPVSRNTARRTPEVRPISTVLNRSGRLQCYKAPPPEVR